MTWFWPNYYDASPAEFKPTATCRHCPARIQLVAAGWVDVDGWTSCRKDVRHEPMPSGLDGGTS